MEIKTMVELRAGRVQITEDPATGAATVTLEVQGSRTSDAIMRAETQYQDRIADLEQDNALLLVKLKQADQAIANLTNTLAATNAKIEEFRGSLVKSVGEVEDLEAAAKRAADNLETKTVLLNDALWRHGEITRIVSGARQYDSVSDFIGDLQDALTAERPE